MNDDLYLPLCGRAMVSRQGIILNDPYAERICAENGCISRKMPKQQAYLDAMRARVIDDWVRENVFGTVIHIGCGLDSRAQRIGLESHYWFDADLPEVIEERRKHFTERGGYKMLAAELSDTGWLEQIPFGGDVTVILEKRLGSEQLRSLIPALTEKFDEVRIIAEEELPTESSRLRLVGEKRMAPDSLVSELKGAEKALFRAFYAKTGGRLYEYGTK